MEEILNNPVQQYIYFHICIKSINMYATVRTGDRISEISICTQSTFEYATINTSNKVDLLINILTKEGNTHEKSNIRSYR